LPPRGAAHFAPDVPSSVTEEEARLLHELAYDKLVLELGSWYGRSTIALASSARRVHSIDAHRGDSHTGALSTLGPFLRNLRRYGVRDRVTVHVGDVEEVAPALARESFDFAFIDGLHTRVAVERDASLLMPLVRDGGLVAFHDYGRYDVADVVDELGDPVLVVGSIAVLEIERVNT
jgi:predicted O-methyltransferase YrrM